MEPRPEDIKANANTPHTGATPPASTSGQPNLKPAPVEVRRPVEPVEQVRGNSELAPSGEGVAENYITRELAQARKAMRNTAIIGSLFTLGVLAYMGYLTARFRDELSPQRAAQTATGVISEKVEEQADQLSEQIKTQVPQLIAQAPDYAKKQIPIYRERLETQIASDLQTHCDDAAKQMDGQLDDFLTQNKTQIASLLKDGQNPQAVKQLGAALQQEFFVSLKKTKINGESAQSKLDQTLTSLREINTRMTRLAANQNLTPQEKKTRRAIAILASMAEHHVGQSGIREALNGDASNNNGLSGMLNGAVDKLSGANRTGTDGGNANSNARPKTGVGSNARPNADARPNANSGPNTTGPGGMNAPSGANRAAPSSPTSSPASSPASTAGM